MTQPRHQKLYKYQEKRIFDRGVNQIQYRPDALTNEKALTAHT